MLKCLPRSCSIERAVRASEGGHAYHILGQLVDTTSVTEEFRLGMATTSWLRRASIRLLKDEGCGDHDIRFAEDRSFVFQQIYGLSS
jgi:hypothetical protein